MKIPVLTYHAVPLNRPEEKRGISDEEIIERNLYSIPLNEFEKQMAWLYQNGYKTLRLAELSSSPYPDEKKYVMLTFDDGYSCGFKNILPVLKKYQFTGAFFIITEKIGQKNYLSLEQLIDLNNSEMEIGSHSVSHSILTKLDICALKKEISNSKATLERILRCSVDAISIPRGFYNKRVIEEIIRAGYKMIFTSNFKYNTLRKKYFVFGRCVIRNDYSLEDFIKIIKMNMRYFLKKTIEQILKKVLKKIVGVRNFDKCKVFILKKQSQC